MHDDLGADRGLDEPDVVFNVVWTGTVFPYLQYFVASQIARSRARFRFVGNGCPPDQLELMEAFAARHPGRVVEVLDVSSQDMIAHGVALDRVRAQRDDGPLFGLIDPDIKANAPFVADLLRLLGDGAAVTSGREVWSEHNVVPDMHPGVAGEFFYDRNGFVFGSPHLAVYRRDALEDTCTRWEVGFGSAGPDLRPDARALLDAHGHTYIVFDTGKIVNILLQLDGHPLVHEELDQLVHIGGLSHYLYPPGWRTTETGEVEPDWTAWETMSVRHEVARYTARTLRALADGDDAPPVPPDLEPDVAARLARVHREVTDLMERYGPQHR